MKYVVPSNEAVWTVDTEAKCTCDYSSTWMF